MSRACMNVYNTKNQWDNFYLKDICRISPEHFENDFLLEKNGGGI